MGQPVVHFEVIGSDGEKLRGYYSELFGWKIDADNPMNYGLVRKEDNPAPRRQLRDRRRASPATRSTPNSVTFYVAVPDVEAALAKAESLGGSRVMGPREGQRRSRAGAVQGPGRQPDRLVKDGS